MTDFVEDLIEITKREHMSGRDDLHRLSTVVAALANALGMTCALIARGDPKTMEALIFAAERLAHETAGKVAPTAAKFPGIPQ